jgi:hypothetical protein
VVTRVDNRTVEGIICSFGHTEIIPQLDLELFDNVSDVLINEWEAELKDSVVRVFFSSFVIKVEGKGKQQRRNITHKLNEPWEGFV